MKTLTISVPCHEGINPFLFEWMISAVNTKGWKVDLALCHDRPVVQSRNRVVREFLKTKSDLLFSIDSDQLPYINPETRESGLDFLLDDIQRPDVDVVNILTVRRTDKGPVPVIHKLVDNLEECPLYREILERPWGCHELVDGAVGGAGMLIKRHVLEDMYEKQIPWFKDVFVWEKGKIFDPKTGEDMYTQRVLGHDIWFFKKCHELGFRAWVDTRVLWGHIKPIDMRNEFVREMKTANANAQELARLRKEIHLLKNGVPA